ncbi:Abi family protein [Treponema sp.]|uniref:Abi family protein n=1 Tax=Treponema sp. TaxID=166 RepID=UPI00388F8B88
MSNIQNKPKLSSAQLVQKMKNDKGITFKIISEAKALKYLFNNNNYLRTASYRKNYQKFLNGQNKGKYIKLDFGYLKELAEIDSLLRIQLSKACFDIEHDLKIRLLKDCETNPKDDGYKIVDNFLKANPYVVGKLEAASTSPFTTNLLNKYFTVSKVYNNQKQRDEYKITAFNDCPVWVFLELITFGDFIKFYEFYYRVMRIKMPVSIPILKMLKNLRNACAHNNCIIADLQIGSTFVPVELGTFVSNIKTISKKQRQKKMSCLPVLEFVGVIYSLKEIATKNVILSHKREFKKLFQKRMLKHKDYFSGNDIIKSNYEFAVKVLLAL